MSEYGIHSKQHRERSHKFCLAVGKSRMWSYWPSQPESLLLTELAYLADIIYRSKLQKERVCQAVDVTNLPFIQKLMALYHLTKYCGQRCTYILLQVWNVLPPLVRLEDNYTRVRHLLKARLFDDGRVALSDFLFLSAVCNFPYLFGVVDVHVYITDWSHSQIGKRNF